MKIRGEITTIDNTSITSEKVTGTNSNPKTSEIIKDATTTTSGNVESLHSTTPISSTSIISTNAISSSDTTTLTITNTLTYSIDSITTMKTSSITTAPAPTPQKESSSVLSSSLVINNSTPTIIPTMNIPITF